MTLQQRPLTALRQREPSSTGLDGTYDIRLEATPWFRVSQDQQPDDILIFDAIQPQLGLRLEPRSAPVEILVLDSAEKPGDN